MTRQYAFGDRCGKRKYHASALDGIESILMSRHADSGGADGKRPLYEQTGNLGSHVLGASP
jgi:hypothetical protein